MPVTSTPRSTTALDGSLEVHLLGLVDYDAALALQERLVYEVSGRNDGQGVLLLCEHPPLITIGREGSRTHVLASQHDLDACEVPVRWVARGGGAVLHTMGQLAVSPILPLDRLRIGVGDFRNRIEEGLLAVCRALRVPAKRSPAAPGLWSRGGQLASFGAAVKNETTCHGAYLNVNPDPGFLSMVESCPPGERVTSLEIQRGRRTEMSRVREAIIGHLASAFGYNRIHVYTSHPLLKRTTKRICQHA
jgi:lipoyl(octanoyl) transferase